ncbi:MAG: M28 family metallopeptidase [Alphaproteobacteria bacterium]
MMQIRYALAAGLTLLAGCTQTAATSAVASRPAASDIAAFAHPPMSPEAILGHIQVLASDQFEGRKPGTHGEVLTLDYMQRAFAAAGLQPGVTNSDGSKSWRQEVPLVSSEVTGDPVLTISGGDGARSYQFGNQYVAWTKRVVPELDIENAPLVFVGYGIVASERNWNDYAGVDMHGKIAVILINDPDFETGDDRGFGGRAMTYYGRWTYKFEEAARQHAAGALIIHEPGPAAYGWGVVQSSNTGPKFDTVHDDNGMSRVGVEGWVTTDVAQELFRRAGMDFATMKTRAQTRGFRPVPMNLTGSVDLHITTLQTRSYNVVGLLPGRTRPDEAVVYSAHWDHLGHCTPVNGDGICNGALDNASGTSGLIELARNFARHGRAARSVVFLSVTAEEQGLLGSQYYADHPSFAPRQIVADINMDGLQVAGPAHDITVIGHGKSEMDDLIARAAAARGRRVTPDPFPERGSFFRSDQFNFARIGVPVLYTGGGVDLLNGGVERGRALQNDYIANRYHKPQDEILPSWDLSGASQDLGLLYTVGREIADGSSWPQWRPDAEFRAARVAERR